ncbi:MAG: lanthionine synthetase LanC family protein [Bacteroidota bacterium]
MLIWPGAWNAEYNFYLSKVIEAGYGGEMAKTMLTNAVGFLLDKADVKNYVGSFFPLGYLIQDYEEKKMSRLGWCYGDPGVLICLWQAAVALNDEDLKQRVIQMTTRSVQRKSPSETRIWDGCLCHGFAGNALWYDRMYRYTGEMIFSEASSYWIDRLLEQLDTLGGIGKFSVYHYKDDVFVPSMGFLTGATGVGLALISVANPQITPSWDRFLLLS